MNKNNEVQEIDLFELISRLTKSISKFLNAIVYFFFRNIRLFALTFAVSIILAFIVKAVTKPVFKSDMICYTNTITSTEVVNLINNWNYKKDFSEIELKEIKSIKAFFVLDVNRDSIWDLIEDKSVNDQKDTSLISLRMSKIFCVRVETSNEGALIDKSMKQKILSFLEVDIRVSQMNQVRVEQEKNMIAKIDKEIKDLDSLKRLQYFAESSTKGMKDLTILNEKEQRLYHSELIELYKQKQQLESNLFLFQKSFEVIQNFSIPRVEENPLTKLLKSFTLNGFLIGLVLIFLWDRRLKIKELIEKSKA